MAEFTWRHIEALITGERVETVRWTVEMTRVTKIRRNEMRLCRMHLSTIFSEGHGFPKAE